MIFLARAQESAYVFHVYFPDVDTVENSVLSTLTSVCLSPNPFYYSHLTNTLCSWWNYLGRRKKYGLVEEVHQLELALRFQKTGIMALSIPFSVSLCLCLSVFSVSLSVFSDSDSVCTRMRVMSACGSLRLFPSAADRSLSHDD